MDKPTRYWGIWQEGHISSGFMTDVKGHLIYYPHPGIAQAHANDVMSGRRVNNLTVREFTYVEKSWTSMGKQGEWLQQALDDEPSY